jgi:hypothetical protein
MIRTSSERYYLHAANRHMANKRQRSAAKRWLRDVRYGIVDWLTAWWV